MGFYEQISKYYDYIFPVARPQLNFIKQGIGEPERRILDVACGTGSYSVELARLGYEVTGIDLDEKMIELAKVKAQREGLNINFLRLDMKDVNKIGDREFNCIFCIGNSIVHLGTLEDIGYVIKKMYTMLAKNGVLILQTVNYDRILKYNVDELPTIKNDEIGLEFARKYELVKEKGVINFNTTLMVNNEKENINFENSVELLPVESSDLVNELKKARFSDIKLYGGFDGSPFNDDSFALVIKARK